ncbi:MAG: bifunctional 23S rRNA (guanine(2069)-N(7))-methyltransferase RlmK/23S rRNA (guanine(2445)-N(2))-methyltransferase RlmL [Planctomycetota bacterium]
MSEPSKCCDLMAACAFGLEALVVRELQALGLEARVVRTGWVQFSGDETALVRANLHLRVADRVLILVGQFEAPDFDALFERTRTLPWEEWIGPAAEFPVKGRSLKSQLTSVPACQRSVKKAIVERLLSAHHVAELPETGPRYSVEVSLLNDVASLTIDTTGASLHKRGYRTLVAGAPLKETLAAALVQLSFWNRERPLIDPFCGIGTIPIEAALIGRNIAPGLGRTFAAEAWPQVDASLWQGLRDEARAAILPALAERILGTDRDPRKLKLARHHAERAGVAQDIHFQQRDFAELSSSRRYGCIITNPPYGEWLGRDSEIEVLYRSIPVILRRLPTWSHYILTARDDFERLIGQQADRRRKLYNGRIRCTYYQFHGPRPGQRAALPSPLCVEGEPLEGSVPHPPHIEIKPAFGGLTPKAHEQAEALRNRLAKRARHLRRWPAQKGITCFRLYERDIPEIPLVIDRYEDHLHVAEFERPHDRSPAEHADWLDLMVQAAAEVLEVDRSKVFVKFRHRQRPGLQYQRQAGTSATLVVNEGGLSFRVNLSDYVDTGLFLDHRITRSMVRAEAAGKRFLNLYCYTGSFTVYAAAGGASSTTSVDVSNTYLEWAQDNMALNDFTGSQHQLIRADALTFLEHEAGRRTYDLVVVDPPTHSNSKRTERDWDIQNDQERLFARLLPLLAPDGVLYFASNYRHFKLREQALSGVVWKDISRQTVPPDFRNRRVHRCWRITHPAQGQ